MDTDGISAGVRAEYAARMNRVLEFIDSHLNEDLDLDILAGVAAYSKFHFHRIFRAFAGEPLAEYITRRRLEKAAYRLRMENGRSITDIALDSGFSNPAVFARNFKARFGMTASEWRLSKKMVPARSAVQSPERNPQSLNEVKISVSYGEGFPLWTVQSPDGEHQVRLETLPEMTLAYLSYTGPYKGDSGLFQGLFQRLFTWLGPRGLISPDTSKTVVIYHEYPDITIDKRLRLSACCTVPQGTSGGGEIGVMPFLPGLCAVSRFVCSADEYQNAWDWMYEVWLPESGFFPSDIPAFESYDFYAYDKVSGKTAVDICIPLTVK